MTGHIVNTLSKEGIVAVFGAVSRSHASHGAEKSSPPIGFDRGEWQPIETAPLDGTAIQARIPGHGDDNIIAWQADALIDEDEQPCGSWAFVTEQEPPDCWTDGWCWAVNEDGLRSAWPTHWKPTQSTEDETQ